MNIIILRHDGEEVAVINLPTFQQGSRHHAITEEVQWLLKENDMHLPSDGSVVVARDCGYLPNRADLQLGNAVRSLK